MKRIYSFALVGVAALTLVTSCNNMKSIKQLPYPETKRGDVVDNYFGREVADPYRWLEDDMSSETAEWVAAENLVTNDYISQIPFRDAIKERLTTLWNYPKESAPSKKGDWWWYYYNDGLQNQSVLYRTKDLAERGEAFLDPNTLSEDGTVALSAASLSDDGKYLAYATSASGSDWVQIRVKSVVSGKILSDKIDWVKFSGAQWAADSKGFYYSAYDAPKTSLYSSKNEFQKVYYHKIGTPQSEDRLIYEDKAHPLRYFSAWESSDGKWLFITASEGTSGSEILYKKVGDRGFKVLLEGFKYDFSLVECKDDYLYYVTNREAMNYALERINLKRPKASEVVISESDKNLLQGVGAEGGYLFAFYLQDAQSRVSQYNFDGTKVRDVALPAIGTVGGFTNEKGAKELYYTLTNYTSPATIYKYDIASGTSELYRSPEVKFDPSQYVTNQIFFESKDGTKVPMFVTHRKDTKLDGTAPTLLYGYGGFQISLTPSFSPATMMFIEQGGIYCVVNLRGGSEYGEKWHKEGMLEKKQNVFDDFIAAAEYLIANNYTSSERLAIYGGSNGGLLVGACEVQRPDLFAVCIPVVGVLDMLRYHKFTIGWGWVVEYGSSDNEEQFDYIYKYSPLHNIKDGVEYPATLVMTADHDDRVVPAHSFKFAAQLQHSQAGDAPVLIRIESNAGHGAGKPTSKRINEAADMYSFIFQNMEFEYKSIE